MRFDRKTIYPVTIIMTRYDGCYEGGTWAAFNRDEWDVPRAATGNDITCFNFWNSDESKLVGVGNTPGSAFADLIARLKAAA